jgi:hypothetical protein
MDVRELVAMTPRAVRVDMLATPPEALPPVSQPGHTLRLRRLDDSARHVVLGTT